MDGCGGIAAGGHERLRTEVELMVTNANLALRDGMDSVQGFGPMWIAWDGNPTFNHFSSPETTTIRGDYDKFLAQQTQAPGLLSNNNADFLHLFVSGPKANEHAGPDSARFSSRPLDAEHGVFDAPGGDRAGPGPGRTGARRASRGDWPVTGRLRSASATTGADSSAFRMSP